MMYYSEKRKRIENSFQEKFKKEKKKDEGKGNTPCGGSDYYVCDFSESDLIIDDWEARKKYKVPYSEAEGNFSFKDKDSWVPVVEETEYVPENGSKDTGSNERDEIVQEMHDE